MSVRGARNLLWLGLALMAPLPVLLGVADGLMPVSRMLLLAGLAAGVVLVESANGAVGMLIVLVLVQALVWLAVLWGVAWLAARTLARLVPARLGSVALALVVVGAVVTASLDLYRTPFRRDGARVGLLESLE